MIAGRPHGRGLLPYLSERRPKPAAAVNPNPMNPQSCPTIRPNGVRRPSQRRARALPEVPEAGRSPASAATVTDQSPMLRLRHLTVTCPSPDQSPSIVIMHRTTSGRAWLSIITPMRHSRNVPAPGLSHCWTWTMARSRGQIQAAPAPQHRAGPVSISVHRNRHHL